MKYEAKNPGVKSGFQDGNVFKTSKIGSCHACGRITRWSERTFHTFVCSEECSGYLWTNFDPDQTKRSVIEQELEWGESFQEATKDIIIVVHNQLSYIRECLESIRDNTSNYQIFIWDNGSDDDTKRYLETEMLAAKGDITLIRSELNTGFILPNNELARMGDGEYIILLNSDTHVFSGWADVMLGCLQKNPDIAQVGYAGGLLSAEGRGDGDAQYGHDIDFVAGWCFCINRDLYDDFGLFNEKDLKFAYCEDSDFSLRLQEAGRQIYALNAPLVYHYGNKTIEKVAEKRECPEITENHKYICERWKDYLENKRVLVRKESQ